MGKIELFRDIKQIAIDKTHNKECVCSELGILSKQKYGNDYTVKDLEDLYDSYKKCIRISPCDFLKKFGCRSCSECKSICSYLKYKYRHSDKYESNKEWAKKECEETENCFRCINCENSAINHSHNDDCVLKIACNLKCNQVFLKTNNSFP